MIHAIFIAMTLCYLIPVAMIILISVTGEAEFSTYGFSFIPDTFSLEAYKILFTNLGVMGRSIVFTMIIAILATVINIAVNCALAYPLTQPDCAFKGAVNAMLLGTMFINGGLMATFMVYSRGYGLKDNPLVYLIPGVGAWGVMVYKTFFKGVPQALIESAELDGASKFQTLVRIILPLSKPIIAMNFFTGVIGMWNSWQTSMIYFNTSEEYWTIQYLMQRILANAEELTKALKAAGIRDTSSVPVETMKYAMCVIATLPVLALFPKMQKYFSKGIAVGSVKG